MSEPQPTEPSSPDDAPMPLWSPSARWQKVIEVAMGMLVGGAYAFGVYRLLSVFAGWGVGAYVAAFVAIFILLSGAVVWHEAGHAAAAWLAGMRLMYTRLGPLLIFFRPHGQRLWWRPTAVTAAVCAVPAAARDERRQWLAFCAGGPAANLLAAIALVAAAPFLDAAWRTVAQVAASVQALFFVVNLLPIVRVLPSDGLQLLRWWRGMPDGHPTQCAMRLLAQWCGGARADELPRAGIERLRLGRPNEQVLGLHLEQSALLVRGEWAQAAALAGRIASTLAQLPPPMAKMLRDADVVLRQELAFAEAMDARSPAAIDRLEPLQATTSCWVVPRMRALRAALAGDGDDCERWLAQSEYEATASGSLGAGAEEAVLRDHVRALAATRALPRFEAFRVGLLETVG